MHPIKRGALVVLLSLGAIGGFSHGFASMACHGSCAAQSRRDEFEDHIADVCTRAAQRQWDDQEAQSRALEHHHHGHQGWGGPQWAGPPPQFWGAPPAPPAAPPAPPAHVDSAPIAE